LLVCKGIFCGRLAFRRRRAGYAAALSTRRSGERRDPATLP
jgi:hypothetical protein